MYQLESWNSIRFQGKGKNVGLKVSYAILWELWKDHDRNFHGGRSKDTGEIILMIK